MDFRLEKVPDRLGKIAIGAAAGSVLLVILFELLALATRSGLLPFGFNCRYRTDHVSRSAFLKQITPETLAPLFSEAPITTPIVFTAELYSPRTRSIFIHVGDQLRTRLQVNGTQVELREGRYFNPLSVHEGFNRLIIRYSPRKDEAFNLQVTLTESLMITPFPFYYLVQPQEGSPFPRILFHITRFLDQTKSLGFLAALLLLFFGAVRLVWKSRTAASIDAGRLTLFQQLFLAGANIAAMQILSAFLFQQLRIKPAFWPMAGAGLVISAVIILLEHRPVSLPVRFPQKGGPVFMGAIVLVCGYTFFAHGSLLPLEPIGYGDMNPHLKMIKTIQEEGRFMVEEIWGIYPQSLHAVVVNSARLLGREPEELLTPLSMLLMVVFLFMVYRFGAAFFPRIPIYCWMAALAISRWPFILQILFIQYSFPAIASVTLFFLSLYAKKSGTGITASILLAAALSVYPYLALLIVLGFLGLHLGSCHRWGFRSLVSAAVSLVPAALAMGLYILNYIRFGFPQQKEGFFAPFLWNPFLSLGFWNTFLLFAGVALILTRKRSTHFLSILIGVTIGFGFNYLLYAFFSFTSTYYIMKHFPFFVVLGVIGTAILFSELSAKRLGRAGIVLVSVFAAALLLGVIPHTAKENPFPGARGATAVNRWLKQRVPATEPILFIGREPNLRAFMQLTLAGQRPVRFADTVPENEENIAEWMVIDRRHMEISNFPKGFKHEFIEKDFAVFRIGNEGRPAGFTGSGSK